MRRRSCNRRLSKVLACGRSASAGTGRCARRRSDRCTFRVRGSKPRKSRSQRRMSRSSARPSLIAVAINAPAMIPPNRAPGPQPRRPDERDAIGGFADRRLAHRCGHRLRERQHRGHEARAHQRGNGRVHSFHDCLPSLISPAALPDRGGGAAGRVRSRHTSVRMFRIADGAVEARARQWRGRASARRRIFPAPTPSSTRHDDRPSSRPSSGRR